MERRQNHKNPSHVKPKPHLSTYGVLNETIKTTSRNGRLAFSILLFVFLSFSRLELDSRLALRPLLEDLSSYWPVGAKVTSFEDRVRVLVKVSPWSKWYTYSSNQRPHPSSYNGYTVQTKQVSECKGAYSYRQENPITYVYTGETIGQRELKVLRAIFGMYVLILTISCSILLFFLVATISSSYEAYTAKVITLKDVFLKFRESWKRPIHTSIFLSLFGLGLFLLLVIFIGLISIFTEGSSTYVLHAIMIVPVSFCYIHLAALCMMSFVVSFLESDYSGLKAVVRGGELIKGKRRQAYLLILLFSFANAGVNTIYCAYSRKINEWANSHPFRDWDDLCDQVFSHVVNLLETIWRVTMHESFSMSRLSKSLGIRYKGNVVKRTSIYRVKSGNSVQHYTVSQKSHFQIF